MHQYHHKYDTIAEYIEAMELAQKQSKQGKQKITDAMLVAMATEAFLDAKRYPKAGDDWWEEKDHVDRTWENLKVLYLKTDAKPLLKQKSKGHVEHFGGVAMSQGRGGPHGRSIPVTMDNLKGCFNSLATAAVAGMMT